MKFSVFAPATGDVTADPDWMPTCAQRLSLIP
jgi:hypothetical protein